MLSGNMQGGEKVVVIVCIAVSIVERPEVDVPIVGHFDVKREDILGVTTEPIGVDEII